MTTHPRAAFGLVALSAAALLLSACAAASSTPSAPASSTSSGCPTSAPTAAEAPGVIAGAERAVVVTSMGTFTMELYPDAAPIATANFVALARCGFYDGISFHRVLAGFVAQAGDPQTKENRADFEGIGTGGPGYAFVIEPVADGYNYDPYVAAMAHSALPDSNGSQFFIDLADLDGSLARDYTIFGKVIEGTDVVDAIGSVAVNDPRRGVPLDPVVIESVTIGSAGS
ncbi:MAG: peptidylprolyl isomerase [Chloroflexota bacterium]|nr:peptidylprolyl isomerase [Chloroflexota bacterium]